MVRALVVRFEKLCKLHATCEHTVALVFGHTVKTTTHIAISCECFHEQYEYTYGGFTTTVLSVLGVLCVLFNVQPVQSTGYTLLLCQPDLLCSCQKANTQP